MDEDVGNENVYGNERMQNIPPRAAGTAPSLPDNSKILCTPENISPIAQSIIYLNFGSDESTTPSPSLHTTGNSSDTAKGMLPTFKQMGVEDNEKDFVLKYPAPARTSSGRLMPR